MVRLLQKRRLVRRGSWGHPAVCYGMRSIVPHPACTSVHLLNITFASEPWGHCCSYSILLSQVNWRKVPIKKPVNGIQTKEPFLSTLHCLFLLFCTALKILFDLHSIWKGTTITLNTTLWVVSVGLNLAYYENKEIHTPTFQSRARNSISPLAHRLSTQKEGLVFRWPV